MTSERELLALRKDVLVARSALQRLRIAHEAHGLRAAVRWPRVGLALAAVLVTAGARLLGRRS